MSHNLDFPVYLLALSFNLQMKLTSGLIAWSFNYKLKLPQNLIYSCLHTVFKLHLHMEDSGDFCQFQWSFSYMSSQASPQSTQGPLPLEVDVCWQIF